MFQHFALSDTPTKQQRAYRLTHESDTPTLTLSIAILTILLPHFFPPPFLYQFFFNVSISYTGSVRQRNKQPQIHVQIKKHISRRRDEHMQ